MTKHEGVHHERYVQKSPTIHEIKVESNHWQLKDMLRIDNEGNLIYFSQNTLYKYDPKIHISEEVFKIDFHPTSIAQKDETIILGDHCGRIAIHSPFSICVKEVNKYINNAIQIYKKNGVEKCFICNNDGTIKTFDFEKQEVVDSLLHSIPINNCELSPDKKMMVSVCDKNEVFFYVYESGKYILKKKLKTTNDASFKASWNASGTQMVVGTQDGYVCIWDMRSTNKMLAKIKSHQQCSTDGAVRSVAFTQDTFTDLLLFTEHNYCFNLVDTRKSYLPIGTARNRQTVWIGTRSIENSILGSAFSPDLRYLYIATKDSVEEYTVCSEERRMFQEASYI